MTLTTFDPSMNPNSPAAVNCQYGPKCLEAPHVEREKWEKEKAQAKDNLAFNISMGTSRNVEVQAVNNDKKGAYYIKFNDNKPAAHFEGSKREKFYGISVTDFEAFRFRGNLPDNGILANKLINVLGRNLADLEQEIESIEANKYISESRKKSMKFYMNMECECNANQIAILNELSGLEQAKVDGHDAFVKKLETARDLIEIMYDTQLNRIEIEINNSENDLVQKKQLIRLKNEIINSKKALLNELDDPKTDLRTIYRRVMDNYNNEQGTISVFQRRPDRPFTFANESKTEAFQNASYAISDHKFSPRRPTNEQLWKQEFATDDLIVLDSRQYPNMRVKDALRTACFLGKKDGERTRARYKEEKKKIREESKHVQENTTKAKLEIAAKRDKDAHKRALGYAPGPTETPKDIFANLMTNASDGSLNNVDFCKGTARVVSQSDVPLYHANDLMSSISFAMNDFGLYFEKMSAKSPVKTGFFFCMMSLTFGAAGFAAIPVAKAVLAAQKAGATHAQVQAAAQQAAAQPNMSATFLHDMCNFMTLGGHTMSATQLQNLITYMDSSVFASS